LDKLLRKLADNGHGYGDTGGQVHHVQLVVSDPRIDVDPAEGGFNSAQVIGIPAPMPISTSCLIGR